MATNNGLAYRQEVELPNGRAQVTTSSQEVPAVMGRTLSTTVTRKVTQGPLHELSPAAVAAADTTLAREAEIGVVVDRYDDEEVVEIISPRQHARNWTKAIIVLSVLAMIAVAIIIIVVFNVERSTSQWATLGLGILTAIFIIAMMVGAYKIQQDIHRIVQEEVYVGIPPTGETERIVLGE